MARKTEHKVDELFPSRWSPRAMSGDDVSRDELMSLFEAARWAPSEFNSQPWRFVYSFKNSETWNSFFGFLSDSNQQWCKRAGALIIVTSKKTFEYNGKLSNTHSFNTGAAWENLALQGTTMGLVVHGMAGFDHDKVRSELDIPEDYEIIAMIAVGKPGDKKDLPEKMQKDEFPSHRKRVEDIANEGKFKWK